MLNQLLPRQADNNFQGHRLALWLCAAALFLLTAMSLNSIFNGHSIAINADGLPLDSYTPAGAQAVVSFYAIWGVTQLTINVLGIIALARYRALVPLMFLFLLLEQLSREAVHHFLPIAKVGVAHGSFVNPVLVALMAVGLILALWNRRVPNTLATLVD